MVEQAAHNRYVGGSSPFTATNYAPSAELVDTVDRFFQEQAALSPGEGLVVAYSGGSDSTALLWAFTQWSRQREVFVSAAHLDHGLDPDSRRRAAMAEASAQALEVPLVLERCQVGQLKRPGESLEAAGRRVRYGFLERVRRTHGARWVATGHHADDQAETLLLRLLFGSGVEGLGGIQPLHGRVVRPLLELPRQQLRAALAQAGLEAVEDPTNRDLILPRNRLRHLVLPHMLASDPHLLQRLLSLAKHARGAQRAIRHLLQQHLRLTPGSRDVAVRCSTFRTLPDPLKPHALALLHRQAGAPYPAGRRARHELFRQLEAGGRVGCDCGQGWRWESRGEHLHLVRTSPSPPHFTYTLRAPGQVEIPELSLRLRLSPGATEAWMFRGSAQRAGLALPLQEGEAVEVRNRRPGDRLQPLGGRGTRRLKEVLIDSRVPRQQRDRLPLLCVGGRIAWVPGVTIDERFRLKREQLAWIAALEPL